MEIKKNQLMMEHIKGNKMIYCKNKVVSSKLGAAPFRNFGTTWYDYSIELKMKN